MRYNVLRWGQMKHYLYMAALVLCQLAWGQMFDPAPINPDPFAGGGRLPARPVLRPQAGGTGYVDDDTAEEVSPMAEPGNRGRIRGPLVPREKTRVAVLGYHNFSETRPVSDMLLRTSELRQQMEQIRRAGISVISMPEFLEWRFGERRLPEKCVLITLDDGWRSVYTDAYPIFREYGYPFHLFLYTQYISGRGDSMSPAMIREMMANGATVGSHSASHPYPSNWRKHEAAGPEAYAAFIDKEIGASRTRLEKLFGAVNTYCYPGGYNDEAMVSRMGGYGYVAAFTVLEDKVTCDEDPFRIHRYMVFGTDASIFRRALNFSAVSQGSKVTTGDVPGTLSSRTPPPPFVVTPQAGSVVPCNLTTISAQLGSISGIDLSTVRMHVSGFGRVPAKVDTATRSIEWTPPCRIYMPNISVHLIWQSTDGTRHRAAWSFSIDQKVTVE